MSDESKTRKGTERLKTGLAEMLKGGVIMDVVDEHQAKIAQDAGAAAVMALERVPADIRRDGGVSRMSDPAMIERIMKDVTIPVMAKCRIGHFAEAQILQSIGVDYIDESEVLTPADEAHHVDKFAFDVPFVCGCRDLGEALRRIGEGAAMLRTKGEAGTGDIVEAVRHMRAVQTGIRRLTLLGPEELMAEAKQLGAPYELVRLVAAEGKLPVPNFAAGGIATPADASLMLQLGAEAVFVGSGIFKSADPAERARAIVRATTHYRDPAALAEASRGLGEPMRGIDSAKLKPVEQLQTRAGSSPMTRIGILALQGDFEAHGRVLGRLGVSPVEVRVPRRLEGLQGLVLPGGESTTLLNLMGDAPWFECLSRFHAGGGALFATCAGVILASREVRDPIQPSLGLLDAVVQRNGYGRQRDSFETTLDVAGLDRPLPAIFIRAPRIVAVGPGVDVLARHDGEPVLVRQGRILAGTFHPELTDDPRLHARFVELASEADPVANVLVTPEAPPACRLAAR